MTHLTVIRHVPVAAEGLCYGQLDLPVFQDEGLPVELAQKIGKTGAVWSSPSRRCLALAEPLAVHLSLPLQTDERLMELSFGEWEGRSWKELEETAEFPTWMAEWKTAAPPGGETLSQLEARVRDWLQRVEPGSVVVTHAGVIRTLKVLLDGVSWDTAMNDAVPHAEPMLLGTRELEG